MATKRPAYIKDKQEKEKEVESQSPIAELARQLRVLKDRKDDLAEQEKEVNKAIDSLSEKLAGAMESANVTSFKVEGVGSVRVDEIHRTSVNDKPTFIAWLDETGQGELAPRSIHPKRLTSLVKEHLDEKKPLPPGVSDFVQKRAVIRRS